MRRKKGQIDLPENVAHIVAINAENSTVMAPLSLYAITCVKIINPIANRLNVPDATRSVILKKNMNQTHKIYNSFMRKSK